MLEQMITVVTVAFQNVSLSLNHGELLVVSGPVGCGKTALLLAVLGEVQVTEGSIYRPVRNQRAAIRTYIASYIAWRQRIHVKPHTSCAHAARFDTS